MKTANWRALIAKKPGIHAYPPGQLSFFSLPEEVLEYLADHSSAEEQTLETGLGASTIVFAAVGSNHICITPATDEIARMTSFCLENGVALEKINFVADYSELALPRLALPELDLVLIDGRHGFPAPMLDWFYTARHLKMGGRLIVDDVPLWPVQILVEYLSSSEAWRIDRVFSRTIAFVRIGSLDERAEWINQANVQAKTTQLQVRLQREHDLKRLRELALSGRVDLLLAKSVRRLFGRS
ncbi:MAG: class I SAM-dependent methyltransferase [Verrucomicrobiia bacterium]